MYRAVELLGSVWNGGCEKNTQVNAGKDNYEREYRE